MVFQNNVLSGASGSGTTTHTIDQSIRFNSADSAYMHRTPSSSGNRKTFTSSCWVKLGDLTDCALPMPTVSQTASYGVYLSGNDIQIFIYYTGSAWQGQLYTNRKFRDPSAWFHFVLVVDTTQAASTERVRFYINGTRETDWQLQNYPNQNQDTDWNNSGEKMGIGVNANGFGGSFGEYYAAEMHYLDGLAYGPEYFGETNSNGIWIPKEYTGSYGTNGFKIDGRDSSDLGDDESGQGNDFTTSGLAAHDQVSDSPTNNFAVANPLDSSYYMGSETFSEGNLQMTLGSSVGGLATMGITSGKWYAEFEVHSGSTTYFILGIYGDQPTATTHYVGQSANSYGYYADTGQSYNNSSASSYGNSYTVSDVIGVAVDLDNNKLYFSKNGTFQNSGDPTSGASGTGAISINPVSSTGLGAYFIASSSGNSSPSSHTINYNFGQDGTFAGNVTAGGNADGNGVGNFKYSVPSGYLALCTKNLGS